MFCGKLTRKQKRHLFFSQVIVNLALTVNWNGLCKLWNTSCCQICL